MVGEGTQAERGAPGGAESGGTPGARSPGPAAQPKLRLNSRRTCRCAGPGRGVAACGSRRAALRPSGSRDEEKSCAGRTGRRTAAARDREGPNRGAEAAAARLGVAAESLGFRTEWLFGCRLREGKSSPQPNFARLARFDAQIPPPLRPRLPAALLLLLLLLLPARSLARWAGPGRAPRSRSRSRPLPVYVSCKSACSLLSKRCHRPLAAGAPRLLPRAPPPPLPGALPAPSSGEDTRLPSPCAQHAHVGDPALLRPRARSRAGVERKFWEWGGERGPWRAGRTRASRPLWDPRLKKLRRSCGPERVRLAAGGGAPRRPGPKTRRTRKIAQVLPSEVICTVVPEVDVLILHIYE
uniref:uncharacterized protein LOC110597985 n=1 Tax=Ictidomys tridecemlineatus TaxID=43179 RepID=UPI001A9E163B|nr:uncharacterized protein LOC110597985 [Ictidomys tridecemlineatus]